MLLHVDPSDPRPLYEQLAAEIRRAMRTGELSPGDRLPPAKELAAALEINANTVLRTLRILRDEGLVDFRRGRGVTVRRRPPADEELADLVRRVVEVGERCGFRRHEIARMVEELS